MECDLDKMKNRGEAPEWVIRKDNKALIKEVEDLRRHIRLLMNTSSISELKRIKIQLGQKTAEEENSDKIDV